MMFLVLLGAAAIVSWQPVAGHFNIGNIKLPNLSDLSNELPDIDIRKVINIVEDDISGLVNEAGSIGEELLQSVKMTGSGCNCQGKTHDCGCCVHLIISEIELDNTVCANITYLPRDYGIKVDISIDGKIIFSDTVSARNPPPLCFAIPYLKKFASACLDFYNMDISNRTFSGCMKLEIRLVYIKAIDADLGCFSIPLLKKIPSSLHDPGTLKLIEEKQRDFLSELKGHLKNGKKVT